MKSIDIDKYLKHEVTLLNFEGGVRTGILYKIEDYIVVDYPISNYLCDTKKGYLLANTYSKYIYKKSHIKKIVEGVNNKQ